MIDTADEYQGLFDVYWAVGVAVMVVIWLAILFMAVRYRRRRGDEDALADSPHDKRAAEVAYVAVLCGVAAVLVYLTFSTMTGLVADLPAESSSRGQPDADSSDAPPAAARVDVIGARWNWRFDYPDLGITQVGTGTQIPTLVVPVGNVRFTATSLDVIHSFFIPHLRFKRDAFPGRRTSFTLGFDQPGFHEAEGECAEFCGLRHAYMHFNVRVLSGPAFRDWVRARRAGRPQELTPALNREGEWE